MIVCRSISNWRSLRNQISNEIGFVPTMGALHQGHLSLVKKAKEKCDYVVTSIFVNPTQFNDKNDLKHYPTNLEQDLELLKKSACDAVFLPEANEIYADQNQFQLLENKDSKILCGKHRSGHFEGVLTVMNKLLHIVSPSKCFMGEKDFQQLHLIKKMTESFFWNVDIVGCPTVRETDGLAMSSRNLNLSAEAREKAPLIHKLLFSKMTNEDIHKELSNVGFAVEYVEDHWNRKFIAASIDGVRLIDNVPI